MKVLSLTQPWASLMAIGAKRIETRSWATSHWGPVAIHASKGFPAWAKEECMGEPFMGALMGGGFDGTRDLPLGAIVAVGNLHKVGRIAVPGDGNIYVRGLELPITGDELEFGDFTPGRYGWVFTNVTRLPQPIPAKGSLGLWDWEWPAGVPVPQDWWLEGGKRQAVYR